LSSNDLLYELQSGFRPSFSTDSCLIHLSDYILEQQDKGHYTGMVVLDLQKAFDTVNHKILLGKLRGLGLDQIATKWFSSYLGGREQIVDVGGTHSEPQNVLCGVPQGSILGPLLFLVYVNDMRSATKCKLLLYADDSALLASGRDIAEIECVLSRELGAINEWLEENRLSLHLGKTQSILFGSKKRLRKANELHISCNGQIIEPGVEVSYLGVDLDQSLSFSSIINKIVSKSTNKIKFVYRNTKNFDSHTKGMLASALVQCHFDYACSMWYSSLTGALKKRLQILQNKVIRYILGVPPRTHLGMAEFSQVCMLPVEYRVDQLKLNHMFNIVHGSAPDYLKQSIKISRNARYETRSGRLACFIPSVKSFGQRSFFFTASKLWNSLPPATQSITEKMLFKKKAKHYLWGKLSTVDQNIFSYY
jgi:hypothetical protein